MTPAPNDQLNFSWDEIPPIRRHLYFYLLLALGALVLESLYSSFSPQGRLAFVPAPPPRITSSEVYPAPVHAVSPSPSEPLQ